MKTLITNTNLFPLFSVGTYDGQACSTDYLIDSDSIDQDFKDGYVGYNAEMYWDGFSFDLFKKDIINIASNYTAYIFDEVKKLNLGIKSIKTLDIDSPREYNFATDTLGFELTVNNNFYKNLVKIINKLDETKRNSLAKYLYDNFTSYDGFMSWTANNIPSLIDNIKNEETRETSVFLYWYLTEFGNDELKDYLETNTWMDYVYENKEMYTEYVTDEFIKNCEMNDIDTVKYVQENYLYKDEQIIINELTEQIELVTDTWDNNELRMERMIKTVNNVFKTIEDKTLNLFAK